MSHTAPTHMSTGGQGWTRTLMVSAGAATIAAAVTFAVVQEDAPAIAPATTGEQSVTTDLGPIGDRVPGEDDLAPSVWPPASTADTPGAPSVRIGGPLP